MRRRAGARVRSTAGFTLIELLAVTALLALVAVLGLGMLQRAAHRDPLDVAEAALRRWEAAARQDSRLHGPQHWAVVGGTVRAEQAVGAVPELPRAVRVEWRDAAGAPLEEIRFVEGRSADWALRLAHDGARRSWHILGLSGQWVDGG